MIPRPSIKVLAFLFAALLLIGGSDAAYAACANPTGAEGEMIYNDDHNVLQFCDDTNWISMSGGSGGGGAGVTDGDKGDISVSGTGANWMVDDDILDFTELKDTLALDASTDISVTGSMVFSVTNAGTGNSFVVNDQASDTTPFVIDASGNVGVGLTTPTQALDIVGTVTSDAVLLKPIAGAAPVNSTGASIQAMTTTQRDALTPTIGMVIFNTTTSRLEFYTGSSWQYSASGAACSSNQVLFSLHMNGANNGTQFPESAAGYSVVVGGGAVTSTAQSKFGGSSAFFNNIADTLTIDDALVTELGAGSFTLEWWGRPGSVAVSDQFLVGKYTYGTYGPMAITQYGTTIRMTLSSTGSSHDITTRTIATGLALNTWYHFALVRNGSTWTSYLNGVQTDTFTWAPALANMSTPWRIGSAVTGYPLTGYIDDVRLTKAVVYTGAFTAPAAALSDCF